MTEKNSIDFKNRLKMALDMRNMRAVDLVEAAGVPKSAISFYLAGKSKPKADRLYQIARALDVSEAWLLGYDVPMQRTDDQKKNDQLAKLIVRMRTDERFYNNVVLLASLNEKQYQGVEQLLAAFDQ
jgi:transcriptional regulator with XRE-family HTH domain